MKLSTAFRILAHDWRKSSIRQHSWVWRLRMRRFLRLMRVPGFRGHVMRDLFRFVLCTARPIRGETHVRAIAAAEWLLYAQRATPDAGVSLGYFPCHEAQVDGWLSSYPETTGYIIQSLLEFARKFDRPDAREQALAMAEWEVDVQLPSGAVQGGRITDKAEPAVFNTGMVLQGWTAALQEGASERVERSAHRAARFLIDDLGTDGHYRTHGPYSSASEIKAYTSLCSWALYRFGDHVDDEECRRAAVHNIEATIRLQKENGWIAENCITNPDRPLTHTIGYTLQGILEVGLLAGRDDFVEAVSRGVEPVLQRVRARGFLDGRFFSDWEPGCFSSCLTGSAQLAIVCYRLFEHRGDERFRREGDRLLDFLKALQRMDTPRPEFRGALAGSHPITARYMTFGLPNWATKYLLDALLLQDRLSGSDQAG